MSVRYEVDCRDESIKGSDFWFSPEENMVGLTVHMDTVRIYLTSDQIIEIMAEWTAGKAKVQEKLSKHLLGHKEINNATQKN